MSEEISPVVGTASVVGFTHGHSNNNGHNHYYSGVSDKDQGYQAAVDAGDRTRDILKNGFDSHVTIALAVERTGAANSLATEKVGAAAQVQAERIRADQAAQLERVNLHQALALSDMRLENQRSATETQRLLAECCCKMELTLRELDTNRLRDDLGQARAEIRALAK